MTDRFRGQTCVSTDDQFGSAKRALIETTAYGSNGPSADRLTLFLSAPNESLGFYSGLVPSVFPGSFVAAFDTRQQALQGFESGPSMDCYLTGASLAP